MYLDELLFVVEISREILFNKLDLITMLKSRTKK
jgi:hypothetical protein